MTIYWSADLILSERKITVDGHILIKNGSDIGNTRLVLDEESLSSFYDFSYLESLRENLSETSVRNSESVNLTKDLTNEEKMNIQIVAIKIVKIKTEIPAGI